MSNKVHPYYYLWALGIIQPATPTQVQHVLEKTFVESGVKFNLNEIVQCFENCLKGKIVLKASEWNDSLFSLGPNAYMLLPNRLRFNKDRTRLFLLKKARIASRRASGHLDLDADGASPSDKRSFKIQVPRPIKPLGLAPAQFYWSGAYRQLTSTAGPNSTLPEVRLPFLSFESINLIKSINESTKTTPFSITGLALCIGISPSLLVSTIRNIEKQYQTFEIEKHSGGTRTITAPRVFLKTIQHWLADYLFSTLPVHDVCHAYRSKRSIISNAEKHTNQKFVAKIDISNFFGTITSEMLIKKLSPFCSVEEATVFSRIVTLNGSIPQGAPTSPCLSNFILFDADGIIAKECQKVGVNYTRYSDDLTFSGENRGQLLEIISFTENVLKEYGFELNPSKTHIMTSGMLQNVTGVTVNEKVQPPRKVRKKIRAMFHQAEQSPENFKDQLENLAGYVSYLNAYPELKDSQTLRHYKEVLVKLSTL
ncbi:retron St85 family RNA-directed DNA polymerase [Halodesulfovibrio sp. MK-HDV]|uniref:retron St85 family RNA-directed DNA polymerase n=1 Tax=Halodesulfovibrio sp. MK-HDV TaxID=2599925 RepID=UPI00136F0F69|nr:retron St85 family RNA-directed DNA polymerase [Halodesulfovibrio sp. MK-HDV]KAF1073915.1 hypothetical protein MKHDV_03255 [Halodesulfovibrio sp. MK-HDV]